LVHEIYQSIQGESTYAGLPCVFVRLTGCPLRCVWCDTPHAFGEGEPMSVPQVLRAVEALPPRLVELTGGEPLAQPECLPLMTALADSGRKVLLETSGALDVANVDPRVTIIMDLKCPGSGEVDANRYANLDALKPEDELKFVIADRRDFDWAIEQIRRFDLAGRIVLFSPAFGQLEYLQLATWILESRLPIRMQLQLHKHVWHPQARGV
jgi:7-carboxy-7-deazaguanine synthase